MEFCHAALVWQARKPLQRVYKGYIVVSFESGHLSWGLIVLQFEATIRDAPTCTKKVVPQNKNDMPKKAFSQ